MTLIRPKPGVLPLGTAGLRATVPTQRTPPPRSPLVSLLMAEPNQTTVKGPLVAQSTLAVTEATTLSEGATITRDSTGATEDALAVSTGGILRGVVLALNCPLDLLLEFKCP